MQPLHAARGPHVAGALSSRRLFLRVGVLGGAGIAILPARSAAGPSPLPDPPARAVIQIDLAGGLSHIDTFDPKPLAPVEYRGEFKAIPSKIDGAQLSEVLRRTAAIADRLTIVRSFGHGEAAHERGTHNMVTGNRPSPVITYPSFGAVTALKLGVRNKLPPYVCIPSGGLYTGTGYLSAAYAPFEPGSEPNSRGFRVRDLASPKGVDEERLARRRKLVETIDRGFEGKGEADAVAASQAFYEQAYDLVLSEEARGAFDINAEPKELRERYGRTTLGQRLLLARRLVQSGVRYVTVSHGGYDHHNRIFPTLRRRMAEFDRAFASLITDLESQGLLDSTLVLVTSEFGRTPRVNRTAGRDHWPRVFSVVLAGAGIRRGHVHGASDATGAEPDSDPVGPADLGATVFTQLGIDPTEKLLSPGDRPIDIVRDGRVISEILA